jgi:hypothetical protein
MPPKCPSSKGIICLAMLFLTLFGVSLRAEDWKTADGKVYENVTVLKADPDAVTILYRDGGALIPLANLPTNLQKRFNYDPAKAKIAADARAKTDAESAQALAIEKAQAAKIQAAKLAKQKAEDAAIAARKAAEEAQYHNRMPSEPDVLEPQNHPNGILGPPK